MSAAAVVMMIATILIVWGGLVASVIALRFLPTPADEPPAARTVDEWPDEVPPPGQLKL